MNVRQALDAFRESLLASGDIIQVVSKIAVEKQLSSKQTLLAIMLAARSLVESTQKPWNVDRIWWETASLAKELWAAAGVAQKAAKED